MSCMKKADTVPKKKQTSQSYIFCDFRCLFFLGFRDSDCCMFGPLVQFRLSNGPISSPKREHAIGLADAMPSISESPIQKKNPKSRKKNVIPKRLDLDSERFGTFLDWKSDTFSSILDMVLIFFGPVRRKNRCSSSIMLWLGG